MPQALIFYEDCRCFYIFGYCFGEYYVPTVELIAVFCYGGRYGYLRPCGAVRYVQCSCAFEATVCACCEAYCKQVSFPDCVCGIAVCGHYCIADCGAVCICRPAAEFITFSCGFVGGEVCADAVTQSYENFGSCTCYCIVCILVKVQVGLDYFGIGCAGYVCIFTYYVCTAEKQCLICGKLCFEAVLANLYSRIFCGERSYYLVFFGVCVNHKGYVPVILSVFYGTFYGKLTACGIVDCGGYIERHIVCSCKLCYVGCAFRYCCGDCRAPTLEGVAFCCYCFGY